MAGEKFAAYLEEWRPKVDAWIAAHAWTRNGDAPADLDRYVYGPLAHFNAGGGKRVRPVLAVLGFQAACSRTDDAALAAGCAIELFQSAALIHDDIADKGELRRGEPCLHRTLGTGLAINVGDAALVESIWALAEGGPGAPADTASRFCALEELLAMQRRTIEGQALDLGWVRDGRWDLAPQDYLAMATLKTAHYSCASPLVIGAIIGGASDGQRQALRAFGLDAGLAFQIKDDLLNLTGDPAKQGKDFRTDITEGKRTLPVLHALQTLEGTAHDELLGIVSSGTADAAELERAVALLEEAGALDYAHGAARELVASAKGHLDSATFDRKTLETLCDMADYFIKRAG